MKPPCVANLDTARQLLEHGVTGEGAKALVDLRRCAQSPGCDDWKDCNSQVEGTWRADAAPTLPEALERTAKSKSDTPEA